MKKGFYKEEMRVSRYSGGLAVLDFYVLGKVDESSRTVTTDSNIVIGRNQYLIQIWNDGSYIPKRGDVFSYRGKQLVVSTAKEDPLHLYYFIIASLRSDLSEVKREREVIRLNSVTNGQIVNLELNSITDSLSPSGYLLFDVAFFTATGTPVNYVGYERVDPYSSSIIIVLEGPTVFNGYLVVTRI